ncbi:MAG: hypothetical protein V4529_16850 [Gemmatimonadota bacterium]
MKFKVVGWYSWNPHNEHVAPFARVTFVDVEDAEDASEAGSNALDKIYEEKAESVDLLNWYVEEVKA